MGTLTGDWEGHGEERGKGGKLTHATSGVQTHLLHLGAGFLLSGHLFLAT